MYGFTDAKLHILFESTKFSCTFLAIWAKIFHFVSAFNIFIAYLCHKYQFITRKASSGYNFQEEAFIYIKIIALLLRWSLRP